MNHIMEIDGYRCFWKRDITGVFTRIHIQKLKPRTFWAGESWKTVWTAYGSIVDGTSLADSMAKMLPDDLRTMYTKIILQYEMWDKAWKAQKAS